MSDSAQTENSGQMPFRVIEVRNNLKAKAKQGNGVSPEDAIRSAEKRLQSMSQNYEERLKKDLDRLRELVHLAENGVDAGGDTGWLGELLRLSHDIEGQAGVFNFVLISFICSSLSSILKLGDTAHPKFIPALQAHADALVLVHHDRIMGDGGAGGRQLVDGLRASAMKVIGDKPQPAP